MKMSWFLTAVRQICFPVFARALLTTVPVWCSKGCWNMLVNLMKGKNAQENLLEWNWNRS